MKQKGPGNKKPNTPGKRLTKPVASRTDPRPSRASSRPAKSSQPLSLGTLNAKTHAKTHTKTNKNKNTKKYINTKKTHAQKVIKKKTRKTQKKKKNANTQTHKAQKSQQIAKNHKINHKKSQKITKKRPGHGLTLPHVKTERAREQEAQYARKKINETSGKQNGSEAKQAKQPAGEILSPIVPRDPTDPWKPCTWASRGASPWPPCQSQPPTRQACPSNSGG